MAGGDRGIDQAIDGRHGIGLLNTHRLLASQWCLTCTVGSLTYRGPTPAMLAPLTIGRHARSSLLLVAALQTLPPRSRGSSVGRATHRSCGSKLMRAPTLLHVRTGSGMGGGMGGGGGTGSGLDGGGCGLALLEHA